MDVETIISPRRCEHCAHFMAEELNTGHCQFHDMYVLRDFDCEKFKQRRTGVKGGELPTGSQKETHKSS